MIKWCREAGKLGSSYKREKRKGRERGNEKERKREEKNKD
jgi:hypothetical protein